MSRTKQVKPEFEYEENGITIQRFSSMVPNHCEIVGPHGSLYGQHIVNPRKDSEDKKFNGYHTAKSIDAKTRKALSYARYAITNDYGTTKQKAILNKMLENYKERQSLFHNEIFKILGICKDIDNWGLHGNKK